MNYILQLQIEFLSGSMEYAKFFVGCADVCVAVLLSLFIQKKASDWHAVIIVILIILLAIDIWKS